MALFSKEEFRQLADIKNDICISIYVPTWRGGMEVLNDKHEIMFKNSIKEARHQLAEKSFKPREIDKILKPAEDLLNDKEFWSYQSDGLAMFITNEFSRYYTLPLRFDNFTFVSDHFYLKPLLPMLNGNGRFYILALSQKKVRMFEAFHHSISEIPLDEYVPTEIMEGLRMDNPDDQLQYHTGSREGEGAMYHGHGEGKDAMKPELIKRFFSRLDNVIFDEIIKDKTTPVVLAGVEYLIPIYKDASSYNNIVEGYVTGNKDKVDVLELHERAWEQVKSQFDNAYNGERDKVKELVGTNRAETDLKEVVKKSYYGLVETLFVANMENKWGNYNQEKDEVEMHNEYKEGDDCLLNFAAVNTIMKGGNVYLVDKNEMPSTGADVAAVFWTEQES